MDHHMFSLVTGLQTLHQMHAVRIFHRYNAAPVGAIYQVSIRSCLLAQLGAICQELRALIYEHV